MSGPGELPGLIPVDAGKRTDPVWFSGANEPRLCTEGVLSGENAGGVDFSQVGDSQGGGDSMDGWDLQSLAKQEYLSTDC